MPSFESAHEEHEENRANEVIAQHEKPKNWQEMQVILMEEYYLSLPENMNMSIDWYKTDNAMQLNAAHRWAEDKYAEAYKKLRMDKNRTKNILDTTLDDVRNYLPGSDNN